MNNAGYSKWMVKVLITIDQWNYEIVTDYRDGFQEEALNNRYSEILGKYDYILGDWGYGQLRLKGFFEDTNHKASYDTKISTLQDYLYEYCNFGCAYFVIKKVAKRQLPKKRLQKHQLKWRYRKIQAMPRLQNHDAAGFFHGDMLL